MKRMAFLLSLAAVLGGKVLAATVPAEAIAENRMLLVEPSSMSLPAGEAKLTIGFLGRTNGIYTGDYRVKVFPYFYKSEKGRLDMAVPDAALAEIRAGKVTAITGTATTSGKRGRCRRIEAIVTPNGRDQGTLKVTFLAGDRKMIFEPVYHLVKTTQRLASGPAVAVPPVAEITGRPPEATFNSGRTDGIHL